MEKSTIMDYALHLVAFIDVLGQRPRIRDLKMPSPENNDEIIEQLKVTAGVVIKLREMFKTAFEASPEPPDLIKLSEEQKTSFRKLIESKIRMHAFSDSVIISISLANENENCTPMNGITPCLFALCTVFLTMLAMQHPIRGGIDIGPCISFPDSEVYGAALERAYYLESTVADYPRIVIGNSLYTYLNDIRNQTTTSIYGEMAKSNAEKAFQLITVDSDNRFILDYLGRFMRNELSLNKEISHLPVLSEAEKFVKKQLECFYNRDEKLFKRYIRLNNYFLNSKSKFT
jgi:hypothetical protein